MTQVSLAPRADAAETSLIATAGASYFPVALIARLPYAMMVVGVLTLVVAARGSLGFAGVCSACVGLGTALAGPLLGAAADRIGQRPVLLTAGLLSTATLALMAWVAYSPLPSVAVLAVAFAIGASTPQVSPMSRSRLVHLIAWRLAPARRARTNDLTMAYESAADEITFIVGPLLVGLVATGFAPWAPVAAAAVLTLVFVTAFALHPSAGAADGEELIEAAVAPVRELLRPQLVTVVAGIGGVGLFFGAMLTSLTAFLEVRGLAPSAGLVYGVMGIGSATLALGVALFPKRFGLVARWLTFAGVMLVAGALLPLVGSVAAMCAVLLLLGIGIGPTLVTLYSLGSHLSPQGRSATVMTILGSAVVVGQASASALTGLVADHLGTTAALCGPGLAAAVVVLAGLGHRWARRATT